MKEVHEHKIFKYPSSEADKRYFKQKMYEWLIKPEGTFTDMIWKMVHDRNNGGYTHKYLHFNEHTQRLRLENDFFEWCKQTSDKIYATIKLIQS
jgi:hypothetical protein